MNERTFQRPREPQVGGRLADVCHPLQIANDLDPLIERIGDARFVLLGEASHGTSEYYQWRALLSRRLIEEHGFAFIAVEGDWPDCYRVNRYVKGYSDAGESAYDVLHAFQRWPTWMWANWEVSALAEWMRRHNRDRPQEEQAGFYGLDVYSLNESMAAIIDYLEENAPDALAAAREAFHCFEPYGADGQRYAYHTAFVPDTCEDEVVELLGAVREQRDRFGDGPEDAFSAEQNAWVAVEAERYYRTMLRGRAESWNVRDHHMVDTLGRLMAYHGSDARAIVWEHNTHIGDARATDMASAGMVNVGQLVREQYGDEGVVLVGFGSERGSVIAGDEWGASMEKMEVPPAKSGSWEALLHRAIGGNCLILTDDFGSDPTMREPRGHRAIGVVYRPRQEWGNYVPTVLPRRYDAFLYIDQTKALHPLHIEFKTDLPPETYPFGL